MTIRLSVAISVLSLSAVAHAQEPVPAPALEAEVAEAPAARLTPHEATCAATYPARLADAKTGLAQYNTYMREAEKARPAVEWFSLHCRFLTELEITVRHIDDPNAFVCDPAARGKPSNLTSELILNFSTLPTTMTFQTRQGENHMCSAADERAGRMVLAFGELTDIQVVEALCYEDDRPSCVRVRETIAKLKAKGHR